ncbi:HARBI1 [Mytilus edulis]|uniref:Putative nuclease HARBI1 n=1 Tax=Mytilus edulis TaxID=6550 RepID=A0A8S3SGJ4_MYTED|nr:HARBI1 [Mytilus edulis]
MVGSSVKSFNQDGLRRPTNKATALTVEQQVCIALRFYASGSFLQVIGDTLGYDKGTVSRVVSDVTDSLIDIKDDFVSWPTDVDSSNRIKCGFYRQSNFPNVFGCIDCTHVRIQAPSDDEPSYVNRKGYHSINVQAVCDFEDKVIEALTSPDVLNTIIPVLAEKISKTLTPLIEEQVKKCIAAHVEPIQKSIDEHDFSIRDHTVKICKLSIRMEQVDKRLKDNNKMLDVWDSELDALHKKTKDMESRLESQEQYSRRTSLRFHNIQVPVDGHGKILHPVNTDDKILSICNGQLGLNLSIDDISRSHVIGKAKYGKCQVIVRFMSNRTRDMVYTNKKYLKYNEDGVFITENLTKFRTDLTKKLSQMKYKNQIHAYWTADGRIFVKRAENSRKEQINSFEDISDIERDITSPTNQQQSDAEK